MVNLDKLRPFRGPPLPLPLFNSYAEVAPLVYGWISFPHPTQNDPVAVAGVLPPG